MKMRKSIICIYMKLNRVSFMAVQKSNFNMKLMRAIVSAQIHGTIRKVKITASFHSTPIALVSYTILTVINDGHKFFAVAVSPLKKPA
jgi:hypothetical protein